MDTDSDIRPKLWVPRTSSTSLDQVIFMDESAVRVPNMSSTSRDQAIVMDESTEPIYPTQPRRIGGSGWYSGDVRKKRRGLSKRSMRSMAVVMHYEVANNFLELGPVEE